MKNSDLTIIILTCNSAHIVSRCLQHLNFDKYKVVVVDNASEDKTVRVVEKNFPRAQILKLEKNIGYGNGNNEALKSVTTEFALILNPDSIILEQDIEIVLDAMKKNPLAANAGPVVTKHYPLQQEELSKKLTDMEQDFLTIKDCYREKIDGNYVVRFIVGAALFLRIPILQKIGFFDEKIFLYYEDDELCKRVADNGYQSIVVPTATAFHLGGKSSGDSLRCLYKKSWHFSWSKFYWKKIQKGELRAKRSAIKFSLLYLIRSLCFVLIGDFKKAVSNLAFASGAFSYFIGLAAFKRDGNSRG